MSEGDDTKCVSLTALSRQESVCCISGSAGKTETQSKLSQGEDAVLISGMRAV